MFALSGEITSTSTLAFLGTSFLTFLRISLSAILSTEDF
jgi:hypothetical protein